MRRHRIPRAAAVLLSTLPLLAASCGDDETAALCDARDDLRTSVENLEDVDVVEGGTEALDDAVSDVEESVRSLRDAAQEEYDDEISAVEDAWDQLGQVLSNLGNQPSASAEIEAVGDSLAELAAATETLVDSLSEECE